MSVNPEAIEFLARKLEQEHILENLKTCSSLEDFEQLTNYYEKLCTADKVSSFEYNDVNSKALLASG